MANLERIYTIPLGEVYEHIRNKRGKRAIDLIRAFALRHMKASDTRISEGINDAILRDGIQKPPRRIKVRIVKDENSLAKVWMIGEEEKLKEAAESKKKADEEAAKKKAEAKPSAPAKAEEKKAPAPAPTTAAKPAAPAVPAAKPATPASAPAKPATAPAAAKPAAAPAKK
ncbi:50S ribosomal protein L31e [uncultured archaeon]|nr:50S ribosomal protein L31e [uncultured archaeon]